MDEILLAATLSAHVSFYNVKLFEIVKEYESLAVLYDKFLQHDTQIPDRLVTKLNKAWTQQNFDTIKQALQKHQIVPYLYNQPGYPAALYNMADPPYVIYTKGQPEIICSLTTLACVGTRAMSSYGKNAVNMLLTPLKRYSICLISGLALGIDGEVHRVCLDNKITTCAVLGGGLDRYEPLTNAHLAEKIVETGCLFSEYPPSVRPQKHHFLERNRIIAALSRATVVIEGKIHSGALVTARSALQNGRDVGAVPGEITSANAEGPNSLIADGASLIGSYEDILSLVDIPLLDVQTKTQAINPLHALLQEQSYTLDALSQTLNIPVREVQQHITVLELEGYINHDARGNYFVAS